MNAFGINPYTTQELRAAIERCNHDIELARITGEKQERIDGMVASRDNLILWLKSAQEREAQRVYMTLMHAQRAERAERKEKGENECGQ